MSLIGIDARIPNYFFTLRYDNFLKEFVNTITEFNLYSMGTGQVLEKNITDQFYYLYKGSQWLTIIPPTRVSQVL